MNIISRKSEFEPLYTWGDGTSIRKCRALHCDNVILIQFLGKALESRTGQPYISWAINEEIYKHLQATKKDELYIMLEMTMKEDWEEIVEARRILSKNKFLKLMKNYARKFPDRDFYTFGDYDLEMFRKNPDVNPQRKIWS